MQIVLQAKLSLRIGVASLVFALVNLFCFYDVASAQSGGSWAEASYKLINGDCPKTDAALLATGEKCDDRKQSLLKDFGDISEMGYFAGLAEERSLVLSCAIDRISEMKATPEKENEVMRDLVEKVRLIAFEKKQMATLESLLDRPKFEKPSFSAASDGFKTPKDPLQIQLKDQSFDEKGEVKAGSALDQYRKSLARAQALRASIPFIELDSHAAYIDRLILQAESWPQDVSIDSKVEAIRDSYKRELHQTQKQSFKEMNYLKEAASKMGSTLDDTHRSSLAQDTDLIESFRQKNKESEGVLRAVACRVDAKHGKGAVYRDLGIGAASAVAGLASAGLGSAAMSGTRFLTMSAARGAMSVRSASILRWASIGLSGASTAPAVHQLATACGVDPNYSGRAGQGARCEGGVIKSLQTNNCLVAKSLSALGVAGSAFGIYTSLVSKGTAAITAAAKAAPVETKAAEGARVFTAADDANPVAMAKARGPTGGAGGSNAAPVENAAAQNVPGQNLAAREEMQKTMKDIGFDSSKVELVDRPLRDIELKVNEVSKSQVAGWMKKRTERDGVRYVFDESRFANADDLAMTEGDTVYLRASILKDLDSAKNRDIVAHETKQALDFIRCKKLQDPVNCSASIRYKAGKNSELAVEKYEDGFFAGEWEAHAIGSKVSGNTHATQAASEVAREEAEILTTLTARMAKKPQPDRWADGRKEAIYSVKLKDGRNIEVGVPYNADASPDYFRKVVAARLNRKHVQDELKRGGTSVENARKLATFDPSETGNYVKGYRVRDGEVVSKHRPSSLVPASGKEVEPLEVESAGILFNSLEEGRAFFKSKDFRDGTYVFLVVRGKDKRDRLMISNRIPSGKDFEEGKYVTHRSLAQRYRELTGEDPQVPAGGEAVLSMNRRAHGIIDRMGTYHFKDRYHPTTDYSADILAAHGAKLDHETKIVRFKPSDSKSHLAGHLAAEEEVRSVQEINRFYPKFLPMVRSFSEKFQNSVGSASKDMDASRYIIRRVIYDKELQKNPEKLAAYRNILTLTQYSQETSTFAAKKTVDSLFRSRNIQVPATGETPLFGTTEEMQKFALVWTEKKKASEVIYSDLQLMDKYADQYLKDVARALKEFKKNQATSSQR